MYKTTSVGPLETNTQISGLERYTMYKVQVSGFTIKGDGPTAETLVRTDEDGKYMWLEYNANKIINYS